jgi:hypothetical protein
MSERKNENRMHKLNFQIKTDKILAKKKKKKKKILGQTNQKKERRHKLAKSEMRRKILQQIPMKFRG